MHSLSLSCGAGVGLSPGAHCSRRSVVPLGLSETTGSHVTWYFLCSSFLVDRKVFISGGKSTNRCSPSSAWRSRSPQAASSSSNNALKQRLNNSWSTFAWIEFISLTTSVITQEESTTFPAKACASDNSQRREFRMTTAQFYESSTHCRGPNSSNCHQFVKEDVIFLTCFLNSVLSVLSFKWKNVRKSSLVVESWKAILTNATSWSVPSRSGDSSICIL